MRVGTSCREGLPTSHDVGQRRAIQDVDHDMDVVRHETPGEKPITLAVKVQQCILYQRSDRWSAQPARPETGIKLAINAVNFGFPMPQDARYRGRQAVRQPEGDELHCLRRVEVR